VSWLPSSVGTANEAATSAGSARVCTSRPVRCSSTRRQVVGRGCGTTRRPGNVSIGRSNRQRGAWLYGAGSTKLPSGGLDQTLPVDVHQVRGQALSGGARWWKAVRHSRVGRACQLSTAGASVQGFLTTPRVGRPLCTKRSSVSQPFMTGFTVAHLAPTRCGGPQAPFATEGAQLTPDVEHV
jgi:hypothetical protein